MNMDRHTRAVIARNVKALRTARNWSQTRLAERAGIAQTAISYIEREDGKSPAVDTLEAVASALRVPTWTLMLPDMPPAMATTAALDKLVHTYTHVSDEGRATIDAIAEAESRYANLPKS